MGTYSEKLEQMSPESGRKIQEDGEIINIADILYKVFDDFIDGLNSTLVTALDKDIDSVSAAPAGAPVSAHIDSVSTTVVYSGRCTLDIVDIGTVGSGSTITIYDNTQASGTVKKVIDGDTMQNRELNIFCSVGCTVVVAATTTAPKLSVSVFPE